MKPKVASKREKVPIFSSCQEIICLIRRRKAVSVGVVTDPVQQRLPRCPVSVSRFCKMKKCILIIGKKRGENDRVQKQNTSHTQISHAVSSQREIWTRLQQFLPAVINSIANKINGVMTQLLQ